MGTIQPGYYHYSQLGSMSLNRYDGNNYRFERVTILSDQKPTHQLGPVGKDEWVAVSADGFGTLVEGESYRDYMDFSRQAHNSDR